MSNRIWRLCLLILTSISAITWEGCSDSVSKVESSENTNTASEGSVSYSYDGGENGEFVEVSLPFKPAFKTVMSGLNELTDWQVVLKDYGELGFLVVKIAGKANNDVEGYSWQYCVDGLYANSAIDKMPIKPGQRVAFYYRPYGECPCKKIGE